MASKILTILCFILIFTVIVVSHEFGHFLLGRINGIKVNEFAIGMGPIIFKKEFKNTTLAIRLFPIGGACVFEGQDELGNDESNEEMDTPPEEGVIEEDSRNAVIRKRESMPEGSFARASVGARIATVLAGPLFNILLAYLLSIFICWFCGTNPPIAEEIRKGSAAAEAGIKEGDTIKKINGGNVYIWDEISLESLLSDGKPLTIEYTRAGKNYKTVVTPKYSEEDDRYLIGLAGGRLTLSGKNINVFKYSAYEVRYWVKATYKSLGYMLSGKGSLDDLAGPVGVANVIDDTIEETKTYGGFTVFLNMLNIAVLLSINLGIINLLPFPAIDGGRLLFLLWEAITKKPVPPEKEGMVHLIGFVLLFILMIVVLFNDIGRFFR